MEIFWFCCFSRNVLYWFMSDSCIKAGGMGLHFCMTKSRTWLRPNHKAAFPMLDGQLLGWIWGVPYAMPSADGALGQNASEGCRDTQQFSFLLLHSPSQNTQPQPSFSTFRLLSDAVHVMQVTPLMVAAPTLANLRCRTHAAGSALSCHRAYAWPH